MVSRSFFVLVATALVFTANLASTQENTSSERTTFGDYLEKLWLDASGQGIRRETFDTAFAGLTPDQRVIAATVRQPEYGTPVAVYVNRIASVPRIEGAVRKAAEWSQTLDMVEQRYQVDRWTVVALWGVESAFGASTGGFDVIRSLATLSLIGYRETYFRKELLAALQILQDGHIARDKMQGSWAGAMGQPQFMPSSFLQLAVDFTNDGRKDIWTSVPDTLASIANYLKFWGWKAGEGWGREVVVPKDFDYRRSRASYAEWTTLGVKSSDGTSLPPAGSAILFFPSGASGPAFLAGENFQVIKRYNNSDVFALAVGHLADRSRGRAPFKTAWPAEDRQLSRDERIALQRKLKELGHPVNDFEGRIDFDLRDAIRAVQAEHGMLPDGHPTPELLQRIGARP